MNRPHPFVELDAWKADAKLAKARADVELRKGFAGVFEKGEGDAATAPIRIRLTTGQRDRDRDTVNPAGWLLDNYRKNPVVLWGHDHRSFPMGKDTGLTIDANGLVGTPVFANADENPWAPHCERLIRGGFLNAASVGFTPRSWNYNEEERGVDFQEQELLEYSIVPIPSNPGALVEARSLGIDIKWIADWATKALDEYAGESGLWVPRATIEAARKDAMTAKVIALPGLKALLGKETDPDPAAGTGGASGEGDGSGEPGASPSATATPSDDDTVIELEESSDDTEGELDIDETELRSLVKDAVLSELGPKLTAHTGRID